MGDCPLSPRPSSLTDAELRTLRKRRYSEQDLAILAHLLEPFERVFRMYTVPTCREASYRIYVQTAFRFLARMMLDLDCTYWAFTWDQILAWRGATLEREAHRSTGWKQGWETEWSRITSTLFFLGVLPYSEQIHRTYHRELAEKWLGKEEARRIRTRFIATAKAIGYRYEREIDKNGVGVLLSVLVFAGKKDLASLTKADLEAWEAQTERSRRVARGSVTCIQRVLGAMGYLGGELARNLGGAPRDHFTWGRTAPAIVPVFERFLADLRTVRAADTVSSYRVALRRFGDWLGEHDPRVASLADIHRRHIEAFKQAVADMRCGDYTNIDSEWRAVNLGERMSKWHQLRMLSCVRAFFDRIEVLEYPERPHRQLFLRGDTPRVDVELPRGIPERDWRKLVEAVRQLTPERAAEQGLPQPFERTRAILAVLLECGLRAGELCRLDTGCLIAARDERTREETHWLRVPVGKLHNDRMIPVRPQVVEAVDAWMRVRGPQPPGYDVRTGQKRDFLFTWHGAPLSRHRLNECIRRLCRSAGTEGSYTSHQFRHTLAILWRDRGMRLETISRMLGHKDLKMTMRYAAVMPPTLRREFETAFAAIDEEHRATAQVRVLLSPEAHVEAQRQWRESLWVDLGIGWCGLTAYHPCETRLACLGCPNHIVDRKDLPLLERQRANLIELRGLDEHLPVERRREVEGAVTNIERRIAEAGGKPADTGKTG